MVHCTSPVGSMDGSVLVESESGEFMDFTTLQVISKAINQIILA